MRNGLSMTSRAEVTTGYAKVYLKASKKDKGRVLGQVVGVTGWSRDNARRRLTSAAKRPPGGAAGVGGLRWPMWEVPLGQTPLIEGSLNPWKVAGRQNKTEIFGLRALQNPLTSSHFCTHLCTPLGMHTCTPLAYFQIPIRRSEPDVALRRDLFPNDQGRTSSHRPERWP